MKDTSIQILSALTVYMKYAKYIPEISRREVWEEICERNAQMHIRKYPHLRAEIQNVYRNFVIPKKVLPSMRSLQFGGRPIELTPSRIFNCAYMPIDHKDAFSEAMFLLLGGTGVGYSVQRRHVSKLPALVGPSSRSRRFVIGDSIEGWADSIKVLMEAYFCGKSSPVFDFSDIRPKGAALVTSGGKAPGPQPLMDCIHNVRKLLDGVLATRGSGTSLTPIEVHDVLCFIADAVLAGGIRRAALICLFSPDDQEMLVAKGNWACSISDMQVVNDQGDAACEVEVGPRKVRMVLNKYLLDEHAATGKLPWYLFEPQRGRANNSAVLLRGQVTEQEFADLWQKIVDSNSGEPGVYFTNNLDYGTNPCAEIGLKPNQFCNLTEINVDDVTDQADLNERARAAAFLGTLQTGYTDFHYLRPIWRENTEEEALIGVGMTGISSGAVLNLDMTEAARNVLEENARVAKLIGVNPAARSTTVKPAGTSSLVLGCGSGIHAWHNDYFLRRIRVGKNEAIYQYLVQNHPELVKDEFFRPKDQAVIEVPVRSPDGAILRWESTSDLLERVKRVNQEWVHAGHRSGDNTHNVSCTISVKPEEWDFVGKWMWENRAFFNGISVLPYDGGTYIQAPYEDITRDTYLSLVPHLHAIDLSNVVEIDDVTDHRGEVACGAGGCELK